MKLAEGSAGLWEYAERYLGVGTRSYSPFSDYAEVEARYHPLRGQPSFDLVTFQVPLAAGGFVANSLDSILPATYMHGDTFVLPIHPTTYARLDKETRSELEAFPPGPVLTVSPSANVRTVFVKAVDGMPTPPHFLKLHFPGRLSRFTRRLRRPIIQLQMWVAEELVRIGCPTLPEVAGGYLGTSATDAWGFLVRESRPVPDPQLGLVVPLFALYGRDAHAPQDPPLLEQLVKRSREPARDYIVDRIIRPMVKMWVRAAIHAGLVLEMHGQNTLFYFSLVNPETAVVYRDSGVYVDSDMRLKNDLHGPLPPVNVIPRDIRFSADQVRSLAYDSFTCSHALAPIARLAAEKLQVPERALHDAARAEFRQCAGGIRILPDTVYYYDGSLHPDGAWSLVDTGKRPLWR